jgi:hypothetical protein
MQKMGKETTVIGNVIVPDFAATLLNSSKRQKIPFTETLSNIKNLVDFHLTAP